MLTLLLGAGPRGLGDGAPGGAAPRRPDALPMVQQQRAEPSCLQLHTFES